MTQPNILFIFVDQQRADTIGQVVNGNKVCPHLEKLAREGVLFTQSYTCQPLCGPARACLMTGTYATENHVYRNGIGLNAQPHNRENTIATWFKNHGYETGYIGKWHLGSNGGASDIDIGDPIQLNNKPIPLDRRGGWDEYWLGVDALEHTSHGYNGMEDLSWHDGKNPPGFMFDTEGNRVEFSGYRVDAQTDYILDYIDSRSGKKPWILFTSFIEPHHQNDHSRYEGPQGSKEKFKFTQEEVPKDLYGADWLQKGDWEENLPDYWGQCWSLDRNVDRLVAKLEEKGILENTLIVYTADHGSHFRTREGEYKRNCADGCLHTPLIIRGPGFTGGKEVDSLVSLLDVVPTLLKSAGIPIPSHIRGKPIQNILDNREAKEQREFIFAQISDAQVGRCIRTPKWKYSVRAPGTNGKMFSKSKIYMEEFLFNLQEDPYERENLVKVPALTGVRAELAKLLKAQMVEIGEDDPLILPSMALSIEVPINERGSLVLDEERNICLRIGEGKREEMMIMDVPLAELFEDLTGSVILDINGDHHFGTFQSVADHENRMEFHTLDEKNISFEDLLHDQIGKKFMIVNLIPSPEGYQKDEKFTHNHHLVICSSD